MPTTEPAYRSMLDEIIEKLADMDPGQKATMYQKLRAKREAEGMKFVPNPGPQSMAYFSEADETFYGGAAGGGKSALICGLATNVHKVSHVFRREAVQLRGIIAELTGILGSSSGLNRQTGEWKLPDGRMIELGGVKDESDVEKWQGRAADLKAFDEITHFSEHQYRYIIGWNRSPDPKQRCRVVCTGNPPTTPEGLWVISYWAPWLDPTHPNPAEPGELRWFTTVNGEDYECPDGNPIEINGRKQQPRSRTFIPAFLEDNPTLMRSGYAAVLEAMPEELRVRLRDGKFSATIEDDEFQVIPTEWVQAAQKRWTPEHPRGALMTAMGVDIAQGGADRTVLAPRYGEYYGQLVTKPGKDTPDGATAAGLIIYYLRDAAVVNIDLGGGWGNSAYEHLKNNDAVALQGIVPGGSTMGRSLDGKLVFKNVRAEMWWRFREALDPSSEFRIALPPDRELLAELTAPKWKLQNGKTIQIEEKIEIKKRLGRSPDKGDAVVQSWYTGENKLHARARRQRRNGDLPTMANLGGRQLRSSRLRGRNQGSDSQATTWRDEQGL